MPARAWHAASASRETVFGRELATVVLADAVDRDHLLLIAVLVAVGCHGRASRSSARGPTERRRDAGDKEAAVAGVAREARGLLPEGTLGVTGEGAGGVGGAVAVAVEPGIGAGHRGRNAWVGTWGADEAAVARGDTGLRVAARATGAVAVTETDLTAGAGKRRVRRRQNLHLGRCAVETD